MRSNGRFDLGHLRLLLDVGADFGVLWLLRI